jgi:glycosyltransferase involved in cell wall biosynthesis
LVAARQRKAGAMSARPLRLLTVGHSYVVGLNRRLPHEIARVSAGGWEVTAVAPKFVRAELRDIPLEPPTNEACRLEPVTMHLSARVHFAAFGLRLRDLLHRDWDMVHIYQEPYIVAGWQTAYWTPARIPFVFYTAQNITKNYPPPFSWMEQYCLRRCAGWIGCGETVVEALARKGYERKPHRRIGFGVDTEVFRPDQERGRRMRQALGWDDSVPVVCFLGRLTALKGIDLLMSALDQVHASWRMLFIGSGPMRSNLEEWSKQFPQRVRILRALHDEVPAYLNAADILCAPSQTLPKGHEQFGRMIIEAFASGLGVIGSDSGEIPHVIGDAGLVVGEKNLTGWVQAIERLLQDRELRTDLAQRGRVRALEHFSWPVIAREHIGFFQQVIDDERSRRR